MATEKEGPISHNDLISELSNPRVKKTATNDKIASLDEGARLTTARILNHDIFQVVLGTSIFYNMLLVMWHTDAAASDSPIPDWVLVSDKFLLAIYLGELAARLYVTQWQFFIWNKDIQWFNLLDMFVVVMDVVLEIVERISSNSNVSLSFLRVARLARLTRGYKIMVMIPMLSGMCRDLVGASQAVLWGSILLFMVLSAWSIITVQFINPLVQELVADGHFDGCERCPRAYSSVMNSNLTYLQQIIAGDSWGVVTIPVIEAYPWTLVIFIPVFVSISLAIMNVILAVIVESAEETRRNDLAERMKMKEKHFLDKSKQLLSICSLIDGDGSGDLTLIELQQGFTDHAELSVLLQDMGIEQEDLCTVFQIMDEDHSGKVDYKEFVHHIYKMRTADEQTVLGFIRHHVMQILRQLRDKNPAHHGALQEVLQEVTAQSMLAPVPEDTAFKSESSRQLAELRQLCDTMLSRMDTQLLARLDSQAVVLDSMSKLLPSGGSSTFLLKAKIDDASAPISTFYPGSPSNKLLVTPNGHSPAAGIEVSRASNPTSPGMLGYCTIPNKSSLSN